MFGVKGPSWLSTILNYNIIQGNVIDYMHCVLLGVTKMLQQLWCDSKHSRELWYCGDKIEESNSKLLQIKSPINITRVPIGAFKITGATERLLKVVLGYYFNLFQ